MNDGIEVSLAAPGEIAEPLTLLERALREGEPVSSPFADRLAQAVEAGELEVLAAISSGRLAGVAVLAFRPSISLGSAFASVEELHVEPEARRRGVGRALLGAVEERCKARRVSYVEVQSDEEAEAFYRASGYESEPGVRVMSRSYAFSW